MMLHAFTAAEENMRYDWSMVMYSEGQHLWDNAKIRTPE